MGLNIFSSSFRSERHFWMGQGGGDFTALTSNLDYAMDIYGKVNDWLAKTTNPRDALGTDADQFQSTNTDIRGIADSVVGISEKLHSGMTPTDDEISTVRRFNDDAGVLWGIIQQHPASAQPPLQDVISQHPQIKPGGADQVTQAIKSGVKDIIKAREGAAVPAKPGVAPAASSSSNLTTPLLIGGGIAAVIVIALVATAK